MDKIIKSDPDTKVKDDPDALEAASEDDDAYEDTGELQIPKFQKQAWLVKMTHELWAPFANMKKGDDDVDLGEVKVWNMPDGTQKVRWRLNPPLSDPLADSPSDFSLVPKDYDLIVNNRPKNTFVFSEKDMDGYKPNLFGRGLGRGRVQDANRKTEGGRVDKSKYRGFKSIPKHTAFVAAPINEVRCVARETEETVRLRRQKAEMEKKARKDLTLSEVGGSRDLLRNRFSDAFIRNTDVRKIRPPEQKYSRLASDVLLSLLAEKFRQYRFWSLRRLKEETRQPEAHLRDELGKIAVLVKTGPAANHWTLKPEMAEALGLNRQADGSKANEDEIAPDVDDMDEDDEDIDDDDDDGEMEDVA